MKADDPSSGEACANNPAWVLLDVILRSGWTVSEIDLPSFAAGAAACDEPIEEAE